MCGRETARLTPSCARDDDESTRTHHNESAARLREYTQVSNRATVHVAGGSRGARTTFHVAYSL
eukprot:2665927-Prymnesium_polylepis.2